MTNGQQHAPPNPQPDPGPRWSPLYTLFLALAVTVAYAWIVLTYFASLRGSYSVESTRLLIVLTLIIAMLGFGGLLIARALFSTETGPALQDRFRLAREIFLVFSGIFGTIIGFYFGTTDQDTGTAPAVEIAYAKGQLTAAVTGGAEPFIGLITLKDAAAGETMAANKRLLTYAAAECPQDASVLVVDGRGRRAEAKVECNATPSGNAAPSNESVNATDEATNEAANRT